jgi:hypothetical protein
MNQQSPAATNFPMHVEQAIHDVNEHERKLRNWTVMNPKRGPKALARSFTSDPALIADSEKELEDLVNAFQAVIGQKVRGNKRLGRRHLFAALVQNFYQLKKLGIKLPANKYLSRNATLHGLARTLVMFDLVKDDESVIMSPTAEGVALRKKLASSYDRVFTRVRWAVEGKLTFKACTPAKIES